VSRFLGTKVSLGHVLLLNAVTVVIVAVIAVAATVGAASPASFRPSGSFRMVTAVNNDVVDVHQAGVNVLSASFTVPQGKVADIQATYNATIVSEDLGAGLGLCQVQMLIDTGTVLKPGQATLLDKGVDNGSGYYGEQRSYQAMKNNLGAGTHNLIVAASGGGTGCWYGPGTLFIDANLH
jgi:hypothetical protein